MHNYMLLMEKLYARLGANSTRPDRTNTGTASIFGYNLEYDLNDYFPLLPFREINFKDVVVELLWFLRGEQHIKFLEDNGCKWWSNQCDDEGYVGPMYGAEWRGFDHPAGFRTPDQFKNLVDGLRHDPFGRRHVVDTWRPETMPGNNCTYHDNVANGKQVIAPCHPHFQCYVEEGTDGRYLSLKFTMRSSDTLLGLPANIASYGLLLHILAGLLDYKVDRLLWSGGDVHLYANHDAACGKLIEQRDAMCNAYFDEIKKPLRDRYRAIDYVSEHLCPSYELPKEFLDLVDKNELDFTADGLIDVLVSGLKGYSPGAPIKARMAR